MENKTINWIIVLIICGILSVFGLSMYLNSVKNDRYQYINEKCKIYAENSNNKYIISPDLKCEIFNKETNKFEVLDIE